MNLPRSVVELAASIRAGELSPVDVVACCLGRIAEVNPQINAVVQLAPDAEHRAARAAAAVARGGRLGPLHGVPFTVKDNIETAGVITSVGVRERAAVRPERDATVVARMRAAGAILLGKTNCPPWAGGIETDNDLYGRTSNPCDPTRTAGGSSGGEAAIIGAGGSPCGLGTDSGGSLRLPAHFCGVAALKPSAGLVPLTGVLDDWGAVGALSDPRTQVGPMATQVADLAVLLRVLAGPDGHDAGMAPVRPREPAAVAMAGLRVAVYDDNGVVRPTAAIRAAVRRAADALADAGARLTETRLPGDGHGLTVEVWRSYDNKMSSVDLYRLLRRWDGYRRQMLEFMTRHDVVLCPVYPAPAPRHGGTAAPRLRAGLSYTTPYSLVGGPCVAVPVAASPDGLPIGVQVAARPWRDDIALAAAAQIERGVRRGPLYPLKR